ncbi:MAG: FAD:protein FMN transferase [Fidelibacterota bacterium]|nr:MAG: FAD:protein FMN transferase [Candidatus Neomarinimicrobiota bacterium]
MDIVTLDRGIVPGAQRFSHEAMATVFEIIILYENSHYAHQAAWEAFRELDRPEQDLSRFIPNSDISRINQLSAGQPLPIGLAAFECLRLCARLNAETNGAFDITIGSLMNCWLDEDRRPRKTTEEELVTARRLTGINLVQLDEASHTVQLEAGPVHIDLGGFGKGYAVDRMAELLRDWSIGTALIHGGASSALAIGAPPWTEGWPLTLSNPDDHQQVLAHLSLRDRTLSGSGLLKGRHIIDPRTANPVEGRIAAWASTPTAATSDALSTAFMIMEPDMVKHYCSNHPEVLAMILLEGQGGEVQGDNILRYGPWQEISNLR